MKNPYNKERRGCWQLLKRTVLGCVVVLLVLGCGPTRVVVQDSRLPPPEFFKGDCPACTNGISTPTPLGANSLMTA